MHHPRTRTRTYVRGKMGFRLHIHHEREVASVMEEPLQAWADRAALRLKIVIGSVKYQRLPTPDPKRDELLVEVNAFSPLNDRDAEALQKVVDSMPVVHLPIFQIPRIVMPGNGGSP